MRLMATSVNVFEMAVVSEVTLHSIAAKANKSLLERLSDRTPEKSTVTEKSEVNKTPDTRPYRLDEKLGMSSDII